ncbi:response regulator [Candidatus Synechococcus calcipolaris G9]|uniref:Response regulator n=1 Tax=Candidatus Synechococcus calcipolaris G9 TaxID=1497997 RepID=A0ABT6EXI6_9SYNE|nr:response regulator [Candidatus Synechococcus calcipolaris]MDG2990525.1 response regulator [Candidatus Synechococcus calcipolaris G9]
MNANRSSYVRHRPLIACIDDSKTVQRQVSLVLGQSGYRVLPLSDPQKVITSLLEQTPDLILMDINLPDMDGYELCRQLQRSPELHHIPIVMLTGSGGTLHRIRARGVGAVDFLTKPIAPDELLKRVEIRLEQCQKEQRELSQPAPKTADSPKAPRLDKTTLFHTVSHLRLAFTGEQRQTLNLATKKLQQAIAQNPNNTTALAKLALTLYLSNQLADALTVLSTLETLEPKNLIHLRNRACIQEQLGDIIGAIACYEVISDQEPGDHYSVGRLNLLQQKFALTAS